MNIVLIHKGNSWYLPYTLYQLHKTNPNATIYFIGDDKTIHFPKWIKHIKYNNLDYRIKELHQVYKHHSSLGIDFELTCIERWFILYAFIKKYNIQECTYIDSDILIFDNLQKRESLLKNHNMTFLGFSAHYNNIKKEIILKQYCDFVIDCYQNKYKNDNNHFNNSQKNSNQNTSDMTFFLDFNSYYPNQLINISYPDTNGTFDISMEEIRDFESKNGFKNIILKNNIPYCKYLQNNILYPFTTLHFQGSAKKLIKKYFLYRNFNFYKFKIKNDFKILIEKIKRKIK